MATFHVDYINGSDANDGSAANPYATMKFALETNLMGAGDDLKVAGSGLTTQDAAATWSAVVGEKILTTSTDLTGSISVGDIVQINPPVVNTKFQDWLVCQVTAVTATTITLYEDIYLPGSAATGSWTIKTIDSIYESALGTMETWSVAATGANVLIEGGYNSTFTSIIGLTYFRRSGLTAGSTSGVCIRNKFANNNINVAEFKNMQFLQWNEGIKGEFGGSIYGQNLRAYQSGAGPFAYFGSVISKTMGTPVDLYLMNVSGAPGRDNYISNFANDPTLDITQNIYSYSGTRVPEMISTFNDITLWAPGASANGAEFGQTYGFDINSNFTGAIMNMKGELTFNIIDSARSGVNRQLVIFNQDVAMFLKPSAINIIDGGLTTAFWNFTDGVADRIRPAVATVQCPTGFLIKDQNIACTRDPEAGSQPNLQLIDDDGTWLQYTGGFQRVSNDFDTGDSSKLFFLGSNLAYATANPLVILFEFEKLATKPTGITIRAKVEENGGGQTAVSSNLKLVNFSQFNNFGSIQHDSTTYTDKTVTLPADATWDLIPVGAKVQIANEMNTPRNQLFYIDSITVNY
tara:strand:- start:1216 stop:2943 length:1728 start_codon:yes stop_codon:yes gene_type:complete